MRITKAMMQTRIEWLEQELAKTEAKVEALKAALMFNPTHNFLTTVMSTNKLARRMIETALNFQRRDYR